MFPYCRVTSNLLLHSEPVHEGAAAWLQGAYRWTLRGVPQNLRYVCSIKIGKINEFVISKVNTPNHWSWSLCVCLCVCVCVCVLKLKKFQETMFIFSSMAALTYPFVYVCRHARPEEPLRNTVSVFSLPSVSTAGAVVEVLKNGISLFCAFNHFSFDGLTRTFQIIQCSI